MAVALRKVKPKPVFKPKIDPAYCPPESVPEQRVIGKPPKRWKGAVEQHIYTPSFYINRILTPLNGVDPLTRKWIRNANDERSAQESKCRFSEKKGQYVVNWVEKYCYLYEGDRAGELIDIDDWQYEYYMQVFGWLQYADDLGRWLRRFRQAGVWIPKKNAKALALDTPIPTPSGWTTMHDLGIGSVVFDSLGNPTTVVACSEIFTDKDCYEITFSDRTTITASGDHLWYVESNTNGYLPSLRTTEQLLQNVKLTRKKTGEEWACNHRVKVASALTLPTKQYVLDPYILGVWLGDGDSDAFRITLSVDDWELLQHIVDCGGTIGRITQKPETTNYRVKLGNRHVLRCDNVLFNKHIPTHYLRGSYLQRLELLRGLMDTDGTISKAGQCSYNTTSLALVDGAWDLICSLGWKPTLDEDRAKVNGKDCGPSYRIQFWPTEKVFKLKRKAERQREVTTTRTARSTNRHITEIRKVGKVPCKCIKVDSSTSLFLAGPSMVVTHNSPTLAATGVYLLIGDGEKGQKVYSVARDGKQAMIAHTHAMEMVRYSPTLSAECKINNTTGTISHLPTRSRYQVVFGENKLSTEGYNGSLLVDETHVVDQTLIDRLKRAGISRREPLHIEMSTAGDSAEGYGETRYGYGKAIQEGIIYNPQFYFMDFSIPQNTGIESLYDEEFIKRESVRCNPTIGRIIRLTELLNDWTESKQSQTELRKFAMYRLNLWTKGGANWIEMPDWLACTKKYTLEQLMEYPCLGGLDLSKTLDFTAFSLVFAVPHKHLGVLPHIWTWHWLPQRTALRYQAKKNLFTLAKNPAGKPFISFLKSKSISYELIAAHLEWVKNNFDLRGIGYDPYNSDVLMERLYNDYGWNEEMMTLVKQNMPTMGPSTAELERLILRKEIRHPGNPVLDWQFEHCEVDEDSNGNKRPIKPDKDDFRKIDGIISVIIALAMFNNDDTVRSAYGDRESILLFPGEQKDKSDASEKEESAVIGQLVEEFEPDDFQPEA